METRESLSRFLDGEFWELKEQIRTHFCDNDLFRLKFNLSLEEHRRVTEQRARYLFSIPEIRDDFDSQASNRQGSVRRSLAIGEVFCTTDISAGVKMGVMAWLFGGAVLNLGSEEHIQTWFYPLKDLKFTGMFAMSERGHGSNVRGSETEARYDPDTQEFIIHTPRPSAEKIYIGNALHGQYACVLAQLYVDDGCKGPHCFIVPIRDDSGALYPGVRVVDMGDKEGLRGVDNGILSFDRVRIPRENLLNRYADVSPSGRYTSTIGNQNVRFSTMLAALVGTRVALSFQALSGMKVGLEIAVKYSLRRRQFGPSKSKECLIADYQTHQLRLMPYLASSLAITFALRHLGELLDTDMYNQINVADDRRLQALAAGLKAYSTWESVAALQACRECTGGMGYMEENRIASLKRDLDVFVTFEGDNVVMMQQVAKELLAQYTSQFKGVNQLWGALSLYKDETIDAVKTSKFAVSAQSVTSVGYILKAFTFKEAKLLRKLAARLLNKVHSLGEEPFNAWNCCLHHVTALAWCHIHKVTLEQFILAVSRCLDPDDKATLKKFLKLYAVHLFYNDRAWFLEKKYISPASVKTLRDKYISLCGEARHEALDVVKAFKHASVCVHAPIAGIPSETSPWAYVPDSEMEDVKSKL